MKVVVAKVASTLILWLRASLLASPTVVPASTVPWRWMAPVRARIASSSVVLPLWNGPTSAMHRGPLGLVPLPFPVAMDASTLHGAGRGDPAAVRRRKGIASGGGGDGKASLSRRTAAPKGGRQIAVKNYFFFLLEDFLRLGAAAVRNSRLLTAAARLTP